MLALGTTPWVHISQPACLAGLKLKPRIDIHSFDRRYAVALEGFSQEKRLNAGEQASDQSFP
jgi:hypothetical protein